MFGQRAIPPYRKIFIFRMQMKILWYYNWKGLPAIENIDEILEVPGIDVIFVGPYDLSQSLGLTGQVTHPMVEEKNEGDICKCQKKGIAAGTFCDSAENAAQWMKLGDQYIAYSVDVGIFYEACANKVHELLGS